MACPIFIHILQNGDVWATSDIADTPPGAVAAVYRVNGQPALVKLGTISGTSPTYAASNGNGKTGRDVSGR
ncbi:MAG: hypothetical protein LAP86_25845 [Acidobacteriia bacterium]|nr:hypothetical protein [Terriglobia bacterium]